MKIVFLQCKNSQKITKFKNCLKVQKWHFWCPNKNSETIFISPISPKIDGIGFCFKRYPLLEGFLANFQIKPFYSPKIPMFKKKLPLWEGVELQRKWNMFWNQCSSAVGTTREDAQLKIHNFLKIRITLVLEWVLVCHQ